MAEREIARSILGYFTINYTGDRNPLQSIYRAIDWQDIKVEKPLKVFWGVEQNWTKSQAEWKPSSCSSVDPSKVFESAIIPSEKLQ